MYDLYEKHYIGGASYPSLQGNIMMKEMKFYGSTTVGERGQIVLPVKLRKDFHIKKSDQLLVIGDPKSSRIALINAESMNTYLDIMSKQIDKMKSTIKKR